MGAIILRWPRADILAIKRWMCRAREGIPSAHAHGGSFCKAFFDLGVDVELAGGFYGFDGVFDGAGAAAAVDFEEDALDAEEEGAAVFFVVVAFHHAGDD